MIVVSQDRYFLDRIVDKLLVVGTDPLGRRCLGETEFITIKPPYTYYSSVVRERLEAEQQQSQSRATVSKKRRPSASGNKPRKRKPPELRRFNKYSVDQIEEMITAVEEELAEMKERFGDAAIYKNPEQLAELQENYDHKTGELDLLYRAYEDRAGEQ